MLHNETPRLENVEARRAADEAASISRTALAYIVKVLEWSRSDQRAHFPEPPPELHTAIATLADDAHAHAPSSRKERPHD